MEKKVGGAREGAGRKSKAEEQSLIEKLTKDDNIFVMNSNYFDEIVKSSGNKFNYIKVD
jgi:hypothetical protein